MSSSPDATEPLVALLARAHRAAPPQAIIASDGDGTVWRGDIGEAMFERAVGRGLLREAGREALLRQAAAHRVRLGGAVSSSQIGAALLAALRDGRYPEREAFSMMAWAFAGWRADELTAWCEALLDEVQFERAIRPAVRAAMRWAARSAIPFWLVSASPAAVVCAAARRLGIAPARVVAMEPAVVSGRLQPRLAAEPSYGEGKLRRLRSRTRAPLLAAFGDSGYDAAMLRAAALPVAVAASDSLRQALADRPDVLWLEGQG